MSIEIVARQACAECEGTGRGQAGSRACPACSGHGSKQVAFSLSELAKLLEPELLWLLLARGTV